MLVDPAAYVPYYLRSLGRALVTAGAEVILVTGPFVYDQLPEWPSLPVRYLFFPDRQPGHPLSLWHRADGYGVGLTRWLRAVWAKPPDMIHVQWAPVPPVDYIAWQLIRRRGIPLVYTVHNLLPHHRHLGNHCFQPALWRTADALIVHTAAAGRDLVARSGISPERVYHIPQGNLDDFAAPMPPTLSARRQLGLEPDWPTILFFGRLEPYKGLDWLVDAWEKIQHEGVTAQLLVVGKVGAGMAPLLARLQANAHVTLVTGYIPYHDLPVYFAAADLVVLPYRESTSSAALMAAYTFGRAVVVTKVGGFREEVIDQKTGMQVEPGDPAALAAALTRLIGDPTATRRMGIAARQRAESRHAWPAIATLTLSCYHEVLRRKNHDQQSHRFSPA